MHTYSYDALNRLLAAVHPNDPDELFTYDEVGNRRTSGTSPFVWQYNVGDQLLSDGTVTYTYDANGNRLSRVESAQTLTLSYDADNRIRSGAIGAATVTAQAYDALGRRIAVTENGITRFCIYDGDDAVLVGQPGSRTRIVHGVGIDEPILYSDASGLRLPFADGLGSITEELSVSGAVVRAQRYEAFGAIVAASGQASGALYGFTSREFDVSIGLQYSRARHYDAGGGRFLQTDPIDIDSGSLNLYCYVKSNPGNWIDPLGLDATVWSAGKGRSLLSDGPRNGNWCGGKWSGGVAGGGVGDAPPKDSLDECCKRHDLCYDSANMDRKECDRLLVEELRALPKDPKQWNRPPQQGTEAESRRYVNRAIDIFEK